MSTAPVLSSAEIVCEGASREEWLEYRKLGIGGSDIASILGLSSFKSPLALYLEKSGELEDDFKESEAMKWGTVLEQPIREEFSVLTGIKTMVPPPITMYRSKELSIALASPDGLGYSLPLVSHDGRAEVDDSLIDSWYEGKAVGYHRKDDWLDDEGNAKAPVMYEAQCMWELAVSGLPVVHLACLLGGQQFIHLEIERDEDLIADMLKAAETFWKRIEDHNPPAADGSASTTAALKRKFAQSAAGSAVDLGPGLVNLVYELQQAKAAAKAAAQLEKEAENKIKLMLGDNEVGKNGDLELITWKTSSRSGYEVKPTITRTLRIGKDAK